MRGGACIKQVYTGVVFFVFVFIFVFENRGGGGLISLLYTICDVVHARGRLRLLPT
jgi:hypothetical protein